MSRSWARRFPTPWKANSARAMSGMLPAEEGTGVIAGGPARAVLKWSAFAISARNRMVPTIPATLRQSHDRRPSQLRTAEQIAKTAASPWKRSWVKEDTAMATKAAEAKTQDNARKEPDRLPERSAGYGRRAGPQAPPFGVPSRITCTRGMIFKVKHLITVEEV